MLGAAEYTGDLEDVLAQLSDLSRRDIASAAR